MEKDLSGILDLSLNAAVQHIANRFVRKWEAVPEAEAPDTLAKLNAYIAAHDRILVSQDHSDRTIFGDAEINHAFRAWHDWTHWRLQAEFDPLGEARVAEQQIADLELLFGRDTVRDRRWDLIIRIEVNGQRDYFDRHGAFPEDQLGFTKESLRGDPFFRVRNGQFHKTGDGHYLDGRFSDIEHRHRLAIEGDTETRFEPEKE